MLVNHEYRGELLTGLLEQIKWVFPHLSIDYILDMGSRAKGEMTPFSDYDLLIVSRCDEQILFDPLDINSDISSISPYLIDSLVASVYGLPLVQIDPHDIHQVSRALREKFHKKVDLIFADTRSCILNLAFETPFSAFRTHWFTLTSNTVLDVGGIQPALQHLLITQRCFHWGQTIDLQIGRFMKHKKLNSLLAEQSSAVLMDDPIQLNQILLKWTAWCLNYLRFAIGTWSLTRNKYYTYRRESILRFISSHLPTRWFEFALALYKAKDDLKLGDDMFFLGKEHISWVSEMNRQLEELEQFLGTVLSELNEDRPDNEEYRYKHNAQQVLNRFSQFCKMPELNVDSWIEESRMNSKKVLDSYLQ